MKQLLLLSLFLSGLLSFDAAGIYEEHCAGCHGLDGETRAMNQGGPFSLVSRDELEKRMIGYVEGTYGRAGTKNIMRLTMLKAKLSDTEDIKSMATYLKSLKK